jgi:hypothetical protein
METVTNNYFLSFNAQKRGFASLVLGHANSHGVSLGAQPHLGVLPALEYP